MVYPGGPYWRLDALILVLLSVGADKESKRLSMGLIGTLRKLKSGYLHGTRSAHRENDYILDTVGEAAE